MALVSPVRSFLEEIDRAWSPTGLEPIGLRIIGSTALMLLADYHRGTKDSDVLKAASLTEDIQGQLLKLAGPETALHRKHRIYLDFVAPAIVFLPRSPLFHPVVELNQGLVHFQIEALDVVDTVVSKLKRFNANDQSDIQAMLERSLVDHSHLLERFNSAVDGFSMDARAEDLPRYVRNLNQVERDYLMVGESKVELPSWLDEG